MLIQELGQHWLNLACVFRVEDVAELVQGKVKENFSELKVNNLNTSKIDKMLAEDLLMPLFFGNSHFLIVLQGQSFNFIRFFLGLFLSFDGCGRL